MQAEVVPPHHRQSGCLFRQADRARHESARERCAGHVAGGATRAEILESFPYLEDEDISACLAYSA